MFIFIDRIRIERVLNFHVPLGSWKYSTHFCTTTPMHWELAICTIPFSVHSETVSIFAIFFPCIHSDASPHNLSHIVDTISICSLYHIRFEMNILYELYLFGIVRNTILVFWTRMKIAAKTYSMTVFLRKKFIWHSYINESKCKSNTGRVRKNVMNGGKKHHQWNKWVKCETTDRYCKWRWEVGKRVDHLKLQYRNGKFSKRIPRKKLKWKKWEEKKGTCELLLIRNIQFLCHSCTNEAISVLVYSLLKLF